MNNYQFEFEKTIVVTGHYGSGKTNLALNLALWLRARGETVTLADLDVVNPYFRTADFKPIAERHGISLVASAYANSNLDIPALSGALDAKINAAGYLIIDLGGDDDGAHALGRYAGRLTAGAYTMLYVVNKYRYLMREPKDAAALLADIEAASRIRATHIANCSSLGQETTAKDILDSVPYAEETARLTGRPLLLTAAMRRLETELKGLNGLFPVDIYVKAPWN
jgi:energy-coupling factor transporter ATP-binding protein EcfA2